MQSVLRAGGDLVRRRGIGGMRRGCRRYVGVGMLREYRVRGRLLRAIRALRDLCVHLGAL